MMITFARKSWSTMRLVLLASCIAVVTPAVASTTQHSELFNFKVYLDDRLIGKHEVTINRNEDSKSVRTVADFDVRFMYIPVYSYTHESVELWNNGCLQKIETRTDDNGDNYYIDANRDGKALEIETQDGKRSLDGCIRTFAYWDPRLLDAERLLNTQTGEYQQVSITDLGTGKLDAIGTSYEARQFRLQAEDVTIDLWYTDNDKMRWLALETETSSGARLRYLPENTSLAGLEAQ
jgi:hypothetical protein